MMFEQCKIVLFNNIIFMKNIENFPEKFNGNFPEKYEIFRTNFPPHITNIRRSIFFKQKTYCMNLVYCGCLQTKTSMSARLFKSSNDTIYMCVWVWVSIVVTFTAIRLLELEFFFFFGAPFVAARRILWSWGFNKSP